jgi:hypothetical protein
LIGDDIIKNIIVKRNIFLIYFSLIIISFNSDNKNHKKITNNETYYSSYSKGLIYIGDKSYLDNITNITKNDILVEDRRNLDNPTMTIRNSYQITSKKNRGEILKVLCEYEEKNPSNWNRSFETMDLEWTTHNILYYLNYGHDHTADVDLDNEDEIIYKKLIKR